MLQEPKPDNNVSDADLSSSQKLLSENNLAPAVK
jgi:hypothetical protein